MSLCTRISPNDGHYFFGYYDKWQFSPDDRWILMQRAGFCDRAPRPDDILRVGMVDRDSNFSWTELGQTTAWCWQQGCMLQWLPGSMSRVVYNVRGSAGYESVVVDVVSGERQRLPHAIYCLHPSGDEAIVLDFARIAHTRPGYGYNGIEDPHRQNPAPEDRGLWSMRLSDGKAHLLFSFADIASMDPSPTMGRAIHWFNHALYSPGGSRLIFLHRWRNADRLFTRMYTCNRDGSELCRISDSSVEGSWHASHFWWRDDDTIVMWGECFDDRGGAYLIVNDRSTRPRRVLDRDLLPVDGHMSFSPDDGTRWLLSDNYPDKETNLRDIFLFDLRENRRHDLGSFDAGPYNSFDPHTISLRCDLHPRWDRRGRSITFDSIHEGFRGVYMKDVSSVVDSKTAG